MNHLEIKYWHKLTPEERKEALDKAKNFGELRKEFKQPDWCNLYEALDFYQCWSLINIEDTVSKKYCEGCEYFRKED